MGSDSNATKQDLLTEQFQSTLPAWGATSYGHLAESMTEFQSTLPAWGATNKEDKRWLLLLISIHAPRMGSDLALGHCAIISLQFQPTFPAGGERRRILGHARGDVTISIHAPRGGSDDI